MKLTVSVLLVCLVIFGTLSDCQSNGKDMIESVEQLNQSKYTISVHSGSAAAIIAEEVFTNAEIVYNNICSQRKSKISSW